IEPPASTLLPSGGVVDTTVGGGTQEPAGSQAWPPFWSHGVPAGWGGLVQAPVAGAQAPAAWHWSSAVQTTGLPPAQAPPWQVSLWVQASASLHAVPSEAFGFEQAPLAGSQAPATWHGSEAVQTTGLAPTQAPPWQVSLWVQALPS